MLQTLLHWEWVQCPGSTHARAGALGLSLLKIPWTKKILTGSAPCPKNSTTLASTWNHPAALRWKRVCTLHTSVTMHGSSKVLYQALDNLQGFQICVSQRCSLKNRTKNAALLPSHPQLFLWPYSGTNVIWPCAEADWEADQAENHPRILAPRGCCYLWEDHPAYAISGQQKPSAAQQMEGRPVGSHSGTSNFLLSSMLVRDSAVNKEV